MLCIGSRQNGEGVDRPMLGLRRMAAMHNIPMPGLFTHPAFSRSNSWRLSTSHLGGPHTSVRVSSQCAGTSLFQFLGSFQPMSSVMAQLFAFGPVVDDGYGIGYMIHNNGMSFNITGWNHKSTPTSSKDFAASMKKALLDMDALCASTAAA
jgi:carnitine O-acetyltransferase